MVVVNNVVARLVPLCIHRDQNQNQNLCLRIMSGNPCYSGRRCTEMLDGRIFYCLSRIHSNVKSNSTHKTFCVIWVNRFSKHLESPSKKLFSSLSGQINLEPNISISATFLNIGQTLDPKAQSYLSQPLC